MLGELKGEYEAYRKSTNDKLSSHIELAIFKSENVISLGVLLCISSIVLSVVISIPVQRNVTVSIRKVTDSLLEFSSGQGDLTVRLESEGTREIVDLSSAFNGFMEKLNTAFKNVVEISSPLSNHAFNVSSSAKETSATSRTQSKDAKYVEQAIQSITNDSDLIAENSRRAKEYSVSAYESTELGKSTFDESVISIRKLRDAAEQSVDDMAIFLSDVEHVTKVLEVIQVIASQTNLLALNAAIEAARAGEMGRGFAVVADQVRILATRTQESATEIQSTIETLQSGAERVSIALTDSRALSECSFEEIAKASKSLNQIANDVNGIKKLSEDNATATRNQVQLTRTFGGSINKVISSAIENEKASSELADVSANLAEMASKLTNVTSQFNV